MSFRLRKKTFKFETNFEAEELTSVAFVSGVLFAKIRLLDGGVSGAKSVWETPREEVSNHMVKWNTAIKFTTKMTASFLSGVLEKCVCRVSVRKELKGGKSYQKLGFVDVNLSEFAGAGLTSERYLLEGYDSKRRLDNSLLKVNVCLNLISGDPCFKVPRSVRSRCSFPDESLEDVELHPGNKGAVSEDYNSDSLTSRSSGFGSLPRRKPSENSLKPSELEKEINDAVKPKVNDGLPFPRSPSSSTSLSSDAFQRSLSVNYKMTTESFSRQMYASLTPRQRITTTARFNQLKSVDQLVEEVLQETNFCTTNETSEEAGLQLFVMKDGRTILGSGVSSHSSPPSLERSVSRKS